MNLSLLILLTGGFLTILSQTIQLSYKYKNDHLKPPEPTNRSDPIDTNTKNAYISNYCITNGLDRMDWIDQKIYRNKYYEIDILCYSIDQLYTVAKYGKWEKISLVFFICSNCQNIQIVSIVHTIRIFKLFELYTQLELLELFSLFKLFQLWEFFSFLTQWFFKQLFSKSFTWNSYRSNFLKFKILNLVKFYHLNFKMTTLSFNRIKNYNESSIRILELFSLTKLFQLWEFFSFLTQWFFKQLPTKSSIQKLLSLHHCF